MFWMFIIGEKALSLTIPIGISSLTPIVLVFLVLLLFLKEIIGPSKYFEVIKSSINSVIAPLLLLFLMVVLYRLLALGII